MSSNYYAPPELPMIRRFGELDRADGRSAGTPLTRQAEPTVLPDLPLLRWLGRAASAQTAPQPREVQAALDKTVADTAVQHSETPAPAWSMAGAPDRANAGPAHESTASSCGFAAIEIDVTDVGGDRGFDLNLFALGSGSGRSGESSQQPPWTRTQLDVASGRDLTVVVTDVGHLGLEEVVGPPPDEADIAVRLGSRVRRVAVVVDGSGAERMAIRTLVKVTASYSCSTVTQADARAALQVVQRVLRADE